MEALFPHHAALGQFGHPVLPHYKINLPLAPWAHYMHVCLQAFVQLSDPDSRDGVYKVVCCTAQSPL